MKDLREFVRECYLRSNPPIDLDEVPEGQQVAPWDHKLDFGVYCALVEEYSEGDANVKGDMNLWCLNQGPTIINV